MDVLPALAVRELSMSFAENSLFTDVSFDVESNDKIGFIGANGVGKTTLFKILCGKLSPVSGSVVFDKNTRIGYMEQHACGNSENDVYHELLSVFDYLAETESEISRLTLAIDNKGGSLNELVEKQTELIEKFENLGGLTYKSRTRSALIGLGFSENDFSMPVRKLSGGQRSKLCLAKLLLSQSNFLLLDEPTNHLDIDSVNWLENFLRDFSGAMIIISHDRYFLDRVTDKTFELEHSRIRRCKGSYSEFIKKKEAENKAVENKYRNDTREIKRIEKIIDQQKRWGRKRNFITAASKQKEADRIKSGLVVPESELEVMHMRFEPVCESGEDVLICRNLSKAFGSKRLFSNVNIHIRKSEHVFILGGNGCGKTTLFRILTGQCPQDEGEYVYGANVVIGYFDQMQQNLNLGKTAADEVWDAFPHMTQTEIRCALASFLFKGDEVFKPLSRMSGGERARISLLKLMLKGGNFLLLDEPTNHLDASSREELEKTLLSYSGTLMIVSHDRYFINKLADRVLVLENDGIKEYLGNYDYYAEHSKLRADAQSIGTSSGNSEKKSANDYRIQKQNKSEERKRRAKLRKAESEIELLDAEIERVQAELENEDNAFDYEKLIKLTQRLEQLEAEQEKQYIVWEELSD